MEFSTPRSWEEALAAKAQRPDALAIAGGTDVMVEINFDRRRPPALIDLTRVVDLTKWSTDADMVRIGAGVTFARIMSELGALVPGLAMASRTVGSPQIRNRATLGGNLGSASPAGDAHPVLLALGAEVEVTSLAGTRRIPAQAFFTGVKRSDLRPDELIAAVHVPVTSAPQQFAKIGTRNAMVIAVASLGLALFPRERRVGVAFGSAAPIPRNARSAEEFLGPALTEDGLWESLRPIPDAVARRFGELVASDTAPIDDVRGTGAYRRHALSVLARRTLQWAWDDLGKAA